MKLATTRSPKFRRLMNLTGLSRPAAAGTLELLWLFTMEQAPAGDVGRWEDVDLEAELDWCNEPGGLISALVSSGWLDRCATHRLVIHDWPDHLPDFLQKRVDRGTLTLAVVTPCPDNGGQRQPASTNGGIREEKGRVEKPREEKPSTRPPAARASRSVKSLCPDRLEPEPRKRILEWAAANHISESQVAFGWQAIKDWSHGNVEMRANWEAAFRNALRSGWCLKGYTPPGGSSPSRHRPAEDVIAEAKRKQAEDDARRASESPEAIGQLIDLSLRMANQ